MNKLYCDYNATSPLLECVKKKMQPFIDDHFGNPSSVHQWGQVAKVAIELARGQVADLLGVNKNEIIFTSGGTEGNNLCILGKAELLKPGVDVLVTSLVEHASVLNVFKYLEQKGFEVIYLNPTYDGVISLQEIKKVFRNKKISLVSVMTANNETGVVMDIPSIAELAHYYGAYFHTDAVQYVGKMSLNVKNLGVDSLVAAGHKLGAPKGVGFVYLAPGAHLESLIKGAPQEAGIRAGTENTSGIVGLGEACSYALEEGISKWTKVRDRLMQLSNGLQNAIEGIKINGDVSEKLPNTLNISIDGIDGETFVINLDLDGIAISTGSACLSGGIVQSHVLSAMGCSEKEIKSSVRFSLGNDFTKNDIQVLIDIVIHWVTHQREKNLSC